MSEVTRRAPTRRWLVALAVILVLGAAGCGSGTATTGSTVNTVQVTTTTGPPAPTTPPLTDPPGTQGFVVFWMRDCPDPESATDVASCRLTVGERRVTVDPDLPAAAMDALLQGPNDLERFNGMSTNIRKSAKLASVTVEGDTATVAFNRYFETAKTRPQTAQVVYTLTQFPTIKNVQITVDGQFNGAVGAGKLTRASVGEFTPPVLVESPAFNGAVPARFKMTGTATTSNGSFDYRVLDAGGAELTKDTVRVFADANKVGPFVAQVSLPAGTVGPITLVTTTAGYEYATPLNAG